MGTRERAVAVLAVLVLAGVIVASTPRALWADSAILPGANIFGVNPNANGTKVAGTLAIYYQVVNPTACNSQPGLHQVDMFFLMQLKLGTNTFAFAPAAPTTTAFPPVGSPPPQLCYEDTTSQRNAIDNFITTVVIPLLFPNSASPTWDLKSVSTLTQDGELQPTPVTAFWAIMDITIAVNP